MIVRTCVFLLLSATLLAQEGPFGPPVPKGEVPPRNVSFERIRDANKEPENWLTYSGGLSSQRHSLLTTIRPANARGPRRPRRTPGSSFSVAGRMRSASHG